MAAYRPSSGEYLYWCLRTTGSFKESRPLSPQSPNPVKARKLFRKSQSMRQMLHCGLVLSFWLRPYTSVTDIVVLRCWQVVDWNSKGQLTLEWTFGIAVYHARFSSETTGELISSGEACDCGSDERNIWVRHSLQKTSRQDWGLSSGSDPPYEERPRPTVYTRQDARYESPRPRYDSARHWEPPLNGHHQHTNRSDASRVQLPLVVQGSASVVIVSYKERFRLMIRTTEHRSIEVGRCGVI